MYPRQADLFWGLNQHFIQTLTSIAARESYRRGDCLFRAGSPASHFHILISGNIELVLDDSGQTVFRSDRVGEIFGWSALLNREAYSASGHCRQPSDVLTYDRQQFSELLRKDTQSAAHFYRQLANSLGERLLQSYRRIEPSKPT